MTTPATISTLADFYKRSKVDWGISNDDLDIQEIAVILKEIDSLDAGFFERLGEMLDNYFGITNVPLEVFKNIVRNDFSLLFEIHCGAETDTAVRDVVVNALLRIVGSKPWPMYGNSEEYKTDFFETLPKLIEKSATGMQLRERSDD